MPQCDVFLSYNSADKPAVEQLARRLVKAGIQLWLDTWNLVPGEPWQEAIEEALDACQTVAVFLGPKGIGPWENEEMRSALEERVRDKSRRVIPVLLPGAPDPRERPLPRFLARLTWVDFGGGLDDDEVFHRLISGIRGQSPGPTDAGVRPAETGGTSASLQENDIIACQRLHNLWDETEASFGQDDLTGSLLQMPRALGSYSGSMSDRAASWVVFLAIPRYQVDTDKLAVIKSSREILELSRWYDTNRPGPRYYAREIFPLARHSIRSDRSGTTAEWIHDRSQRWVVDVLKVAPTAEVLFATSYRVFDVYSQGARIFRFGAIMGFLWSFLCLVRELYDHIGYPAIVHLCVALVNTQGSVLGHVVKGWPDPYTQEYWQAPQELVAAEICTDPNILVTREIDLASLEPKVEPGVLLQVAEEIALAYHQTEARCFERNTGKLMEHKLHI